MEQGQAGLTQYVIPAIVILVVMALRLRGVNKPRPLRLGQLWIVPGIYAALLVGVILSSPPTAAGWAILVGALAVGALAGWQRGKFMHIEVDPATSSLLQTPSRMALLFIVALIFIRMGARSLFPAGGADPLHGPTLLLTDGLLGFAMGMLSATRAEMYIRGKRLLDAARLDPAAPTAE